MVLNYILVGCPWSLYFKGYATVPTHIHSRARILLVSIRVSFENQKNRCLGNYIRNCSWFLWSTLLLLFSGRCLWRVQGGNVICFHNVKSIFVCPQLVVVLVLVHRGASLRGFLLVDILWYILLVRVCSSTILANLTLVPQWRRRSYFSARQMRHVTLVAPRIWSEYFTGPPPEHWSF